jgi:hypothetical protein
MVAISVRIFTNARWARLMKRIGKAMANNVGPEEIENTMEAFKRLAVLNIPRVATNLVLTVDDLQNIVSRFSIFLSFVELMILT